MNEYVVIAEVKLIVFSDNELDAKEEFEQSLGWLMDSYKIISTNKVVED